MSPVNANASGYLCRAASTLLLISCLLSNSAVAGTETAAADTCPKNVVLMGYWPPTNEMLRPWNTNPSQNPDGWAGRDWRGYGADVYAFFPEFPPDGDPVDDAIGSPGSVGSPDYDLQVDFQATSADFWRIVDRFKPQILITTSRGGSIGWEVEAVEGGHGSADDTNPANDWRSDGYGAVTRPEQDSISARSWQAISSYRAGNRLTSALPLQQIAAAAAELALTSVAIDTDGTSGNYLSGFLGLHGLYYHQIAAYNVAAGHIHVGREVSTADARRLMEATLATVLEEYPAAELPCP